MSNLLRALLLTIPAMVSSATADEFTLDGERLELRAQARVCYLGIVKLYDIDYMRQPGHADTAARCVRLSYLRDISAPTLAKATRQTFEELHGSDAAAQYQAWLRRIGLAYEPVRPGDRYTYCVDPNASGVLLRDDQEVVRITSADFAERFLQIWVAAEDHDQQPTWRFDPC